MPKKKLEVPEYAFTMANTKTGLSISAGADDYGLFIKSELIPFFKHFKEQDTKLKNPFQQIKDGEIEVVKRANRRVRRARKSSI